MQKAYRDSIYCMSIVVWFLVAPMLLLRIITLVMFLQGKDFMQYYETNYYVLTLATQIVVLLPFFLWDIWKEKMFSSTYRKISYKKIISTVGVGVIAWIIIGCINQVLLPFFPDYGAQMEEYFPNQQRFMSFLVLVLAAPLIEEYLFRGKIQQRLQLHLPAILAVLIQGITFGVLHGIGMQKIYATILGITFGFIQNKYKNLWYTTLIHMTINGIGWLLAMVIT